MNNDFEFKYKAPSQNERKEIESIRNSYMPKSKEEQDMETLRSLDWKVKNIPMILSISIGVIGVLILGVGLTMCLEWNLLIWGIVVGIVSLPPIIIAYPLYIRLSKKMRDKYGKQIIELSDKLLNNVTNED
ncbi:MAG: hypothetical protein IJZ62_00755 [Clostridia bacterium]|nr:hypothetical protein [Clostridia bacterium]